MADQPDYYAILGVDPLADAAAIDAAYQGRMLRFRVGRFAGRGRELAGPSPAEIERAYAVLRDPDARARYDATRAPERPAPPPPRPPRRRLIFPLWLWGLLAFWLLALAGVASLGLRGLAANGDADTGATGNLGAGATTTLVWQTPDATRAAAVGGAPSSTRAPVATAVAALPAATATATPPAPTSTVAPLPSPTVTSSPPPTATAPATMSPTATTVPTVTATPRPSPAPAPSPTATATATAPPPAPTATPAPSPEPVVVSEPEAASEPEVTSEPPPPLPPDPTPAFRATDRIGTAQSVNLRAGPGTNYRSLGTLRTGTLLAATGETARPGGVLWRHFVLADGRDGWVRDIDVFSVP